jgi:DNA-binding transcriptional LysR family regulator
MPDPLLEHLAGMAVFARVVELRGFSAAARSLGVTKSAVSKRVARLEATLGAQLLRRTTRSVSVTDSGRALYERAAAAVALCRDASGAIAELAERPAGLLRVTAPVTFGRLQVAPLLPRFLAEHPGVQLQLVLLDREVDLVQEGFDVGVRFSRTLPQDVVARPLAPLAHVLCAAPGMFKRGASPRLPADLAGIECLRYGDGEANSLWRLDGPAGTAGVRVSGRLQANNSDVLRQAAIDGLGVALLPRFVVDADLAAGRLKPVLRGWAPRAPFGPSVYAVWAPDRHMPPKMRVFIDCLVERLGRH